MATSVAAVDSPGSLPDCQGRVWPVSVEHTSVCAEYEDASITIGEVAVDAEQSEGRRIRHIWPDSPVRMYPAAAEALRSVTGPILLVRTS